MPPIKGRVCVAFCVSQTGYCLSGASIPKAKDFSLSAKFQYVRRKNDASEQDEVKINLIRTWWDDLTCSTKFLVATSIAAELERTLLGESGEFKPHILLLLHIVCLGLSNGLF